MGDGSSCNAKGTSLMTAGLADGRIIIAPFRFAQVEIHHPWATRLGTECCILATNNATVLRTVCLAMLLLLLLLSRVV
jgi:hypothetical protein